MCFEVSDLETLTIVWPVYMTSDHVIHSFCSHRAVVNSLS